MTLARLGEEPIVSTGDTSKRALALVAIYGDVRDMVLSDHPWNFATIRANINPLLSVPIFSYAYEYAIPSGCLRFWGICGTGGEVDPALTFQIEGQNIITNVQASGVLPVKYTVQITNESLFSMVFVSTFALRLAAELVYRLTKNAALKQEIMKEYLLELGKAKATDSQQGTPNVIESESWLESRDVGSMGAEAQFGGFAAPATPTPIPLSYLDTDGTLAANDDVHVPSVKAVVTYVAARIAAAVAGIVATAVAAAQAVCLPLHGKADTAGAADTAANLSGTPALPNGTTATTQGSGDNSTKLASTAFVWSKIPATVAPLFALLENRQTQNTAGGASVSGSWQIYPLNTEQEDANSIVNSSALPAFTLAAGTYHIEANAPFVGGGKNQLRLYDVTNSAVKAYGGCGDAGSSAAINTGTGINTLFTIAAPTQFRLEYQVGSSVNIYGLGAASNFGPEVYGQLKITKIS